MLSLPSTVGEIRFAQVTRVQPIIYVLEKAILYQFVALLLWPILLVQALWVKRNTLRLPEAEGERSGKGGYGMPLNLLILGDSAAAGVGVDTQDKALSGCLSKCLAQYYSLNWTLVARSGATTVSTLNHLKSGHGIKVMQSNEFDLVLVSLGVNDVLSPISVNRWLLAQRALIDTLHQYSPNAHIVLTPVPPLGVFPAFPSLLGWFLGQRAAAFNGKLRQLASGDTRCCLLDLQLPVNDEAMARDGFHPSSASYQLWGEAAASHYISATKGSANQY
ncbi:SGNH/GDSL hydrolase family protein [Shewanella colwelliana]|uniref:SGNH/GDSL hydrolase family protein n=1 Tax=Shewanella colwelliana TaxID=23 RepID=UPI00299F0A16|nr:SGNH/GDSL hydrolase family protein [Shewanella colwelliana]MDX1281727.1 SGNH/GDSL hydrolase family protein [Shewanella colwelliana]